MKIAIHLKDNVQLITEVRQNNFDEFKKEFFQGIASGKKFVATGDAIFKYEDVIMVTKNAR